MHGSELELQSNIGAHIQLGAGVGYAKAVLAADAPSLGGLKGQQLENVPVSARHRFTA